MKNPQREFNIKNGLRLFTRRKLFLQPFGFLDVLWWVARALVPFWHQIGYIDVHLTQGILGWLCNYLKVGCFVLVGRGYELAGISECLTSG
jgi:hypothetical protein